MSTSILQADGSPHRAYLVQGADPGLVSQTLSTVVEELSSLDQSGLVPVEEYGGTKEEGIVLGPALDACRTPPFLADRRFVVIRDLSQFDATQVKEVVAYLTEPLDSTVLVVVHTGRSAPAAVGKLVRAIGIVVDAAPASNNRARSEWISEHLRGAGIHLDHDAASLLQSHLGEDLARLEGMIATLEAAFSKGTTIRVDDLTPFLGTAGGIAPWDLTDALDAGDINAALSALGRLTDAGGRHQLQILAVLHSHYGAMLRLDGSDIADEQSAAAATGLSPFPAKKALAQTRRLGHDRVARAIQLLAAADLDVRGRIGWPPEIVLEVLVARLAQLARLSPRAKAPRAGRS